MMPLKRLVYWYRQAAIGYTLKETMQVTDPVFLWVFFPLQNNKKLNPFYLLGSLNIFYCSL